MNRPILRSHSHRFTARLSKNQFDHIKSQGKPSDYLRMLIEKDMVQNYEQS